MTDWITDAQIVGLFFWLCSLGVAIIPILFFFENSDSSDFAPYLEVNRLTKTQKP